MSKEFVGVGAQDEVTSDALWREYLASLPREHRHHHVKPDTFSFGTGELAEELAQLVVVGKKRVTTSLAIEFTSLNEPLPQVGDVSIILRGDGCCNH